MRWTIIFVFTLMSCAAFGSAKYAITLGKESRATAWLRDKKIGSKNVHLIGYKSKSTSWMERVVSKKDYLAAVNDFRILSKDLQREHSEKANPLCRSSIQVQENSNSASICENALEAMTQQKLTRWFNQHADLVIQAE